MRIKFCLLIMFVTLLTGCQFSQLVYRHDVEQGNVFDAKQIEQLSVGLSRAEVISIMGSALVEDPFHPNRWDYVHRVTHGNRTLSYERITVFFDDNGLVERLERA